MFVQPLSFDLMKLLSRKQNIICSRCKYWCLFMLSIFGFSSFLPAQQASFVIDKNNPLKNFSLHTESHPFFIDIDGDHDLDCFSGEYVNGEISKIYFYRNDGNYKSPSFKNITGSDNPLDKVILNTASIPYFIDIDDDGDYDCFISDGITGAIVYYENTGTKTKPEFKKQSAAFNPLSMVKFSASAIASAAFADIDGDGDYDCLITDEDGNESYFNNTGSATKPLFMLVAKSDDPFQFLQPGTVYNASFGDWDSDGLIDLFVNTTYYKNTGTKTDPEFAKTKYNAPAFQNAPAMKYTYMPLRWVDLNNDGNTEVFEGSSNGSFIYQTLSSPKTDYVAVAANAPVALKVFPNPSKDEFVLNVSVKQSTTSIMRVTDIQGKIISTQIVNNNTTRFGRDLKPGFYFVQVMQNNKVVYNQKIIKEE